MSEPRSITYVTDDPTPAYNMGIDSAKSKTALLAFLREWPNLAPDAHACAKREIRDQADWAEWRRGLAIERTRQFAGEEWAKRFGEILIPTRMLRAGLLAERYAVPWGLAWIRLKEEGVLDGAPEETT